MARSKEWCIDYIFLCGAEPRVGHSEVVLGGVVKGGHGPKVADSAENKSIHSDNENQERQGHKCVCGKPDVLRILLWCSVVI